MAYLLELLNSTLVNATALVDQVTGGGGLAGVDVSDDDDVDMSLFLTVVIADMSAMAIDIKLRLGPKDGRQAQAV